MNSRSLELLEYDALRALLGRYVASDLGRAHLNGMQPVADLEALGGLHADAAEAIEYWREAARGDLPRPRFEGLNELSTALSRLRIEGASLDALEILSLTSLLERAGDVRHALLGQSARFPRLARTAGRLADFRPLLRDLSGKILPDGTVADSASVALARIRRELERQRKQIQESLERFLRQHRESGILQEEFVTIRNDRFVVPVVPGAKRKLPGVVHGASGSGHTLFLEPLEAIELNNDLVRLAEEELHEVHRILLALSDRLRESAHEVLEASDVLGVLDFVFAKARFAQEFEAVVPTFGARLSLRQARHPLLMDVLRRQRKQVVPINLELTAETNTLLISGPNTGGKTVSLKTAGLLALMAQSGLPVTAGEAEFPLFDEVLADIGDNQSIEASLSSFSGQVARLKEMVESATPGSLVLLDELGRATDPEEGGALGIALLDEFRAFGAFTLASTHLMALKVYGANTPGVLSASMGFNQETLEPTYVLRTGAPGKSAGLEIAERLGLPLHLIQRARAAMTASDREISSLISTLEARTLEARQAAEAAEARERALREREQRLEKETEKKREAKIREVEQRAEKAITAFDRELREVIEQALSAPDQRRQAEKVLRQAARVKRELREAVAAPEKAAPPADPQALKEGARVRLKDVSGPAKIHRLLANDLVEVEVGLLKMQVSRADVLEVLPAGTGGPASKLPSGVRFEAGPRFETLTREINVIGRTADDALAEVDKFLDTAALAEVTRVRIVHGHGMGVLRKAIHNLLSHSPHVARFEAASPAEGGAGATIAELRT